MLLLAGFVALLVNIMTVQAFLMPSFAVYAAILIAYALNAGKFVQTKGKPDGGVIGMEVGYGDGILRFDVPKGNVLAVLGTSERRPEKSEADIVRGALGRPVGTPRLSEAARGKKRVAVITSDITRPVPTAKVMPAILDELGAAGVGDGSVTLYFALGSHRRHTEEERARLAGGEAFARIKCVDAVGPYRRLGTTAAGTPVEVCEPVADADMRICIGNIEYHYFAGYSGGAKALIPGCASRDTIQANHRMMAMEGARAGNLDRNPVRDDLEEAARFAPIDFILNLVLDEGKRIVHASAGHYVDAHREGCAFIDSMYKAPIPRKADIVVTSPGGYPKDINMYQAQKALDNAKEAVKDGGTIILAAACGEGMGEATFERWLAEADGPDSLIERAQSRFELGGHKAAAIAMVVKKAEVTLVSELDGAATESMYMRKAGSVGEALGRAFDRHGPGAEVIIMPYGASTLPYVAQA